MKFQCPECGFVMEGEDGKPPRCHRHSLHFSIYRDNSFDTALRDGGHEMLPIAPLDCPDCGMKERGWPNGVFDIVECEVCGHQWHGGNLLR